MNYNHTSLDSDNKVVKLESTSQGSLDTQLKDLQKYLDPTVRSSKPIPKQYKLHLKSCRTDEVFVYSMYQEKDLSLNEEMLQYIIPSVLFTSNF